MDKKTEEDGWRGFLEACLNTGTTERLDELFRLFLTPTERSEISQRFLIVRELLKGEKTQREIANDIPVSLAKVSRGSNELKETGAALKRYLER